MAEASKGLILLVDDDRAIAGIVAKLLEGEGYEVKAAHDAFQARGLLGRLQPDLVVLDRKLPDADGLDLCREIRRDPKRESLPVLFLTMKGGPSEKVVGLKLGADDYLAKPFDNDELLARVEALLRRSRRPAGAAETLKDGELEVDLEALQARLKGKPLALGPKEFELLRVFLENRGRALSRAFLLERVWGYERGAEVTTRVVDATVSNLRAKLGAAGKRIVSVLQHGYRFEASS